MLSPSPGRQTTSTRKFHFGFNQQPNSPSPFRFGFSTISRTPSAATLCATFDHRTPRDGSLSPAKPSTPSKIAAAFGLTSRPKRSRQDTGTIRASPRSAKRERASPSALTDGGSPMQIDEGTDHEGNVTIIRRPLGERNTPGANRDGSRRTPKGSKGPLTPRTPVTPSARPQISRPYPLGHPASPASKVEWVSSTLGAPSLAKATLPSRLPVPATKGVFSPKASVASSKPRLTPIRPGFLERPVSRTPSSPLVPKHRRGSSSFHVEEDHTIPGTFCVVDEVSKQGMSGTTLAVCHRADVDDEGTIICFKSFNKQRMRQDPGLQDVFLNELRAYKRLGTGRGNSFVMQILGSLQSMTSVFLAMPIMTCDLRAIIHRQAKIIPAHSRRWIAQMVTGIGFLHERGVIHRDFKPENLLVDARLNIRISDFGLSYVTESDCRATAGMELRGYVGTKEYVAPELWNAPFVHGREVDYWALGCVSYELLSGSHSVLFVDTTRRREEFSRYGTKLLPYTITDLTVEDHAFVSSLLRMNPSDRRGYRELKNHTFFVSETDWDVTEFDDIERRALERSESFRPAYSPPRGLMNLIRPIVDIPQNAIGELFAGVQLTWINPISAWRAYL